MRTCPSAFRFSAPAAALAALLAAGCLCAAAQAPKPGIAVFRGEVVRFDSAAITVRSAQAPLLLHTFTYSPALRQKVIRMLETGGYQYGDKVKIRCVAGGDVALSIRGKASKTPPAPKGAGKKK